MKHRETTTDPYNSVGKLVMAECERAKGTYKYFCKVKLDYSGLLWLTQVY